MRRILTTPIAATALIAAALFSSCSKEEYDLENVGDEIEFSTSLGAPIANINAKLSDLFDLTGMTGTFKVSDTQAQTIMETLGNKPQYLKGNPGNYTIDLSQFDGDALKELNKLDIDEVLKNQENEAPVTTDFIEIKDMDDLFGSGNPINEIEDFTIDVDVTNETPFNFSLKIQFATGDEDFYLPITDITPDDKSEIEIEAKDGLQQKSLVYTHISADKLKTATGIMVTYSFGADQTNLTITHDQTFTIKLKTFVSATVDFTKF